MLSCQNPQLPYGVKESSFPCHIIFSRFTRPRARTHETIPNPNPYITKQTTPAPAQPTPYGVSEIYWRFQLLICAWPGGGGGTPWPSGACDEESGADLDRGRTRTWTWGSGPSATFFAPSATWPWPGAAAAARACERPVTGKSQQICENAMWGGVGLETIIPTH